jgi:hypothetical protein
MKYLKLKTNVDLPHFIKDEKIKQSHITFVYFGQLEISEEFLTTIFKELKPFVLKKVRIDKFGKDNDISVVVYEITDKNRNKELHDVRLQLLDTYNLLDQNFTNWNPHISSVDFESSPELIDVIGIESDDFTFSITF